METDDHHERQQENVTKQPLPDFPHVECESETPVTSSDSELDFD